MDYTDEQIRKITMLGQLGYGLQKCANIMDFEDNEDFKRDFKNSESRIAKAYQKGQDIADFSIDAKLFELAKSGNITAMDKFELRKRMRE